MGLVFRKDVRGWETLFDSVLSVVNVFFPRYFKYRPTFGTVSYYFFGSEACRNEIHFTRISISGRWQVLGSGSPGYY